MGSLISVVIPTFNGERYIHECIESIQKQKMDTEIIIIDDMSTDNTVEIAKSYHCKIVVNKEHKGQIAGKNTGIRLANGKYWLTIDQDDMIADGALQYLYDAMQQYPDEYIIMAKLKDFCSPDTPEQIKFCKPQPFYGILTGSTLFRKEIFDIIGFWNEGVITGDVIDLTNRLMLHNLKIKKVDFIACNRRIHKNNYGRTNQKDEYKDYAKALSVRIKNRLQSKF